MTETAHRPEQQRRETEGPGPLAGVRVVELGMLLAGPFTGPPARRHGRRDHQGRAAGPARSAPRVGQGALRGPLALVAGAVAQQEVRDAEPSAGGGAAAAARASSSTATCSSRTSARGRWRSGASGRSSSGRSIPKLVIARVSGYGQTGPYAPRAGFASVAEAMGGIRHINGFPGEPPPRIHISLGDSLAGMFAVQGILAALYWRDALGGGRGQVVDVSLMEACFALLESMVPEYDRLGIVRGPGRHRARGRRAVEHLQVERRHVDGDRGQRGRCLPAALRGDGPARARRRPAVATHLARGENQEELEGIVADVGGAAHRRRDRPDAQRRRRDLRADLHDRGHLRGRAVPGPRDARRARGSRVRRVLRARGSSRSSPRRRARCAGPPPGRRAATTETSTAACSASPTRSWRASSSRASCDRDDLRRRAPGRAPERASASRPRDARRARQPPCSGGIAADRDRQLRQSRARSADGGRRGGRRRIDRRDGVVYAGLVLNEQGYDRLAATGLDEAHFAFASTETLNRRNQNASRGGVARGGGRDRRASPRGRHPRDGDDRHRIRLPVRGRRRPRLRARASPRCSRTPRRTRSSSPTPSASACHGR